MKCSGCSYHSVHSLLPTGLSVSFAASVVQWLARLTTNLLTQVWSWTRAVEGFSSSVTSWSINGNLGKPGEGRLWKLGCHPMSQSNGLISTTGSKACEERWASAATCSYSIYPHFTFLPCCSGKTIKVDNLYLSHRLWKEERRGGWL